MTPRRILLLVGGLTAFVAAYTLYARMFGWLDGLPVLPSKMSVASDGTFRMPPQRVSPTSELLKAAFTERGPETESANYPTQLRFLQGDSAIVLAAGSPPANPNSNRVTLTPFSMAVFGKPRPPHLLLPGEVTEISTLHADKAVLEFDRVIQNATDMGSAKLVRLELVSDPEQAVADPLKREGRVHIVNNQRSADPNRHIVMTTPGPVFYRDPKVPPGSPPLTGPDIWTDAGIEIVDRSNLPRRPDAAAAVAPSAPDQVRTPAAVAAVLAGQRLPPPTVTAVGMRLFLEQKNPPGQPARKPRANAPAVGGIRRVELLEKVVMNLWVDGGQGLIAPGSPAANADPGAALAAVAGGLVPGVQAARAASRDLLQVETRGPFAYDTEKSLARFDVLPVADPNLPNDVQVSKVPPRVAGTQTLFSQVLELEFKGDAPAPTTPAAPKDTTAPVAGARFKRLHAWTYTPGRYLTLASDADQLQAYAQDLVHEQAAGRTQLTGSPLYAIQKRNVLTAGGPKQSAVLLLEPPPNSTGEARKPQATVLGAGKVELYDAASNATSVTASWQTSMTQTRERAEGRELELFTITDGAKFADEKADFWLKGKVLKLWLTSPPQHAGAVAEVTPTRSQPHRLQALGDVSSHSADMDVEHCEHLNTLFREEPVVASVAPAAPAAPSVTPAAPPQPAAPKPAEPAKPAGPPKPPMKLRARVIETWIVRTPRPASATPPAAAVASASPAAGMKYQLERARCEGMVNVHQDPVDPTKPRGTDIIGSLLLIDGSPEGNVLTVLGWDNKPGEVHNEGTSLIGPKIVIDQLHNLASVEGRGSLAMASSSDLSGATLRQAEVVQVHFRDGMTFYGAKKVADFFGRVSASQGGSWITCHTLQVTFDRPVYLSQANRPPADAKPKDPKAPAERPKIDVVYCYPAPADAADSPQEKQVWFNQVDRDPVTGKPVRRQQVVARELTLRAQARDTTGGEPYKQVLAEGPGVVRTWQAGAKDDDPAGPRPAAAAPKNAPEATEMKLTIVNFSGRMTAKDKGPSFKDATFLDSVQVIHVPTDNPDLDVQRHKMPDRATLLTCADKLVVWTHTKAKEPTQQHMEAFGNAYLRNAEYDGWGETVKLDGKAVIFEGVGTVPARIKNRFSGNDQSGKVITFDRATNYFKVEGSIGGTITPPPPRKMP